MKNHHEATTDELEGYVLEMQREDRHSRVCACGRGLRALWSLMTLARRWEEVGGGGGGGGDFIAVLFWATCQSTTGPLFLKR